MKLAYASLLALITLVTAEPFDTVDVDNAEIDANRTLEQRGFDENFGQNQVGWIQAHYLHDCQINGPIPPELLKAGPTAGKGSDAYMTGPRTILTVKECHNVWPYLTDNIGVNWGSGKSRISRLVFYASSDCSGPIMRLWDCLSKDNGKVFGNCNDGRDIKEARSTRVSGAYSKGGRR